MGCRKSTYRTVVKPNLSPTQCPYYILYLKGGCRRAMPMTVTTTALQGSPPSWHWFTRKEPTARCFDPDSSCLRVCAGTLVSFLIVFWIHVHDLTFTRKQVSVPKHQRQFRIGMRP